MSRNSPIKLHEYAAIAWELARGFLQEDLTALHEAVRALQDSVFSEAEDTTAIQSVSTTGSMDNFAVNDTTVTIVVDSSVAVFTGFANPTPGREFTIINKGTGLCAVNHNSSSSIPNFRVYCPTANGIVVGTNGIIKVFYDSDSQLWRAFIISAGNPLTQTYAAGDFTANGAMTWTVQSGDVTTFAYLNHNKLLTVWFNLVTTSVAGVANTTLNIVIPSAYTATKQAANAITLLDNGVGVAGYALVAASGTQIQIHRADGANFTASANNTSVFGQITFEVN
jgi:hypothetical protein